MTPGPVSDSYDPEWGTSYNSMLIDEALEGMHRKLGELIGSPPRFILEVVLDEAGGAMTATFTEQEWRILRFACERARESI